MRSFPMFFKTSGRRIVIVGGGEQAAQKCRLLLKTDAQIIVISDTLEEELAALEAAGKIQHSDSPLTPHSFSGAILAFVATGCPAIDRCAHALAKAAGILVNVVDQPDLCDVTTPSIVDRDPVVVAIGTEGTAPVLARRIKAQMEQILNPKIGRFAASVGLLRNMVTRHVPKPQRRDFWRSVFTGQIWQDYERGAERKALADLKTYIKGGHFDATGGSVTLIDTSAGSSDLISLRAVERLQEADEIFYESPNDETILELARRDAERHILASSTGANPWPAKMSISFVKRAASDGRKIVWLKNLQKSQNIFSQNATKNFGEIRFEVLHAPQQPSASIQAVSA
ncbi:MAG: NAD(P)-dependent oxidoreductase [Cognatishimia sp.]